MFLRSYDSSGTVNSINSINSINTVHADEHAGAMYMAMNMMRPGLFFQREGPGSEPGNSLLCPDEAACSVCGVLGMVQCRASLLHDCLNGFSCRPTRVPRRATLQMQTIQPDHT